jgi:hypothetical protein
MASEKRKKRPTGRMPSQRDRRSHRVDKGSLSEERVQECLDDLEERGLIRVIYDGDRRGLLPLIGARQWAKICIDLSGKREHLTLISDDLSPETTMAEIGWREDPDDTIAAMIRHAHLFPGGKGGQPLGDPPRTIPGVVIKSILASEMDQMLGSSDLPLGVAELDQGLKSLVDHGYIRESRSPDGTLMAYLLRYEHGVISPWPDEPATPFASGFPEDDLETFKSRINEGGEYALDQDGIARVAASLDWGWDRVKNAVEKLTKKGEIEVREFA